MPQHRQQKAPNLATSRALALVRRSAPNIPQLLKPYTAVLSTSRRNLCPLDKNLPSPTSCAWVCHPVHQAITLLTVRNGSISLQKAQPRFDPLSCPSSTCREATIGATSLWEIAKPSRLLHPVDLVIKDVDKGYGEMHCSLRLRLTDRACWYSFRNTVTITMVAPEQICHCNDHIERA
jgi:hypothetical protein